MKIFLFFIVTMFISFGAYAECDRDECKFTFDIADAQDCLEAYTKGKFKKNFRANNRDMSLYYYDGYLYIFHVKINKTSIYSSKFNLSFCESVDID